MVTAWGSGANSTISSTVGFDFEPDAVEFVLVEVYLTEAFALRAR